MALFPWEPGWKWPWEAAQDTSQTLVDGLVRLTVGGLISIVGILVLAGIVKLPGGIWTRILIGGGVTALGLCVVMGWIGGIGA